MCDSAKFICLPEHRWVPGLLDWRFHTIRLPSALQCSLHRWLSPLWASTGNICPTKTETVPLTRQSTDVLFVKMSVCIIAHLLPLLEFSEHYNRMTFPFPNHPPEIHHCVRQRTLCGNVVVFLSVSLGYTKTVSLNFSHNQGHYKKGC